jgi:hypothetical protein
VEEAWESLAGSEALDIESDVGRQQGENVQLFPPDTPELPERLPSPVGDGADPASPAPRPRPLPKERPFIQKGLRTSPDGGASLHELSAGTRASPDLELSEELSEVPTEEASEASLSENLDGDPDAHVESSFDVR